MVQMINIIVYIRMSNTGDQHLTELDIYDKIYVHDKQINARGANLNKVKKCKI